jgi:hypothetical protein
LSFSQNNDVIAQARFWSSKVGVQQGIIETKDGKK